MGACTEKRTGINKIKDMSGYGYISLHRTENTDLWCNRIRIKFLGGSGTGRVCPPASQGKEMQQSPTPDWDGGRSPLRSNKDEVLCNDELWKAG